MVGAYCQMQYHLITTAGIALTDAYATNFLLDSGGQFHWVDFGFAMRRLDDSYAHERGLFGYAMATLLLSIYSVNIQPEVLPSKGYNHEAPCRYCLDPRLDTLTQRYEWLRQLLVEVRRQPGSAFHDPEFYRQLGAQLPQRVNAPAAIIMTNQLLRSAWRVREAGEHLLHRGTDGLTRPGKDRA